MATKTVGRLKIQLDAVTNRFDKGMKGASKRVTRFQRGIARAKKVIGGFGRVLKGVAIAAAAAGAALAVVVGKSLERLDTLAKTSDKLGITTEKLSGLQMAAQLTGVEVAAMGDGLQKMQKNIAEAARGTGEAVESFELLGISAAELISMTPDEQFIAIAEAMQGVTTQADKMEIAMGIFGRGGGGLLNTLALGAEGLREIQGETEALGVAFSRLELAQVEAANDSMLKVKTAIQGVADKLAIALAPSITAASGMFVDWAQSGVMGGEEIEGTLDKVISKLETVGVLLDGLSIAFNATAGAANIAAGFTAEIASVPGRLVPGTPKVGSFTDIAGRAADEFAKGAQERFGKAGEAATRIGESSATGGTGSGFSESFREFQKRRTAATIAAEENAQRIMAQRDAEKARSEAAIGATPAGVARGGSRIGGTGADGIWRGDQQTERSANLLQHIVDNGIPLAVGSTP